MEQLNSHKQQRIKRIITFVQDDTKFSYFKNPDKQQNQQQIAQTIKPSKDDTDIRYKASGIADKEKLELSHNQITQFIDYCPKQIVNFFSQQLSGL